VSGTLAGFGVKSDGTTYTGSYDASTVSAADATQLFPSDWKVGPGIAPKADLYMYRVFGCNGSSSVVSLGIDKAVADGVNVQYGVTASDVGTGLMQALQSIAQFNAGGSGNFATSLSQAQSAYLTGAITTATTVDSDLNAQVASNGFVSNRLTDAQTQQTSMTTLYKGFVSNIQDTNMADAATQLSLNQTQLQAALQVTAGLHQLSLLNYLPSSGG